MNQNEHIEMIIGNLSAMIIKFIEEYNLHMYMPFQKNISSCSIEDLYLNNENSIYDQLDGVYKKGLKNSFIDLKKINFLGNPKLFYFKDKTIKIRSSIIDTLWFHGDRDSIYFIIKTYLKNLKNYLLELDFIKYVQYAIDIPGLKLKIEESKLTIEDSGIIITFTFEKGNVDYLVNMIKPKLKDKKMDII